MPLTDIFEYEIAGINKRNKQELEPVDMEAVELKSVEGMGVIEMERRRKYQRDEKRLYLVRNDPIKRAPTSLSCPYI
jgi:hypothetical protein